MEEFTKKFNKLYHKIPSTIQPIKTTAMVAYPMVFEPDFVVSLQERRSITLLLMQADAVALEGNLIAVGKIQCTSIQGPEDKRKEKKDKKKAKDDPEPSSSVKESPEAKIEDMSQIIRNLSNKIIRLEVKGQAPGRFQSTAPRNPNTFRRPFNPHSLPATEDVKSSQCNHRSEEIWRIGWRKPTRRTPNNSAKRKSIG